MAHVAMGGVEDTVSVGVVCSLRVTVLHRVGAGPRGRAADG